VAVGDQHEDIVSFSYHTHVDHQ